MPAGHRGDLRKAGLGSGQSVGVAGEITIAARPGQHNGRLKFPFGREMAAHALSQGTAPAGNIVRHPVRPAGLVHGGISGRFFPDRMNNEPVFKINDEI